MKKEKLTETKSQWGEQSITPLHNDFIPNIRHVGKMLSDGHRIILDPSDSLQPDSLSSVLLACAQALQGQGQTFASVAERDRKMSACQFPALVCGLSWPEWHLG